MKVVLRHGELVEVTFEDSEGSVSVRFDEDATRVFSDCSKGKKRLIEEARFMEYTGPSEG